jgi:CheY-specific phosphatase CheX
MKKTKELLMMSIFEAFERMFYIFLEPSDPGYGGHDMEASICFDGTLKGEMKVFLPSAVARKMVQNMLSLDGDKVTAPQMEDCAREAVNVICGNFLSKLDQSSDFRLTLPKCSKPVKGMAPIQARGQGNVFTLGFDAEGGEIGVVVVMQ